MIINGSIDYFTIVNSTQNFQPYRKQFRLFQRQHHIHTIPCRQYYLDFTLTSNVNIPFLVPVRSGVFQDLIALN